MDYDNRLADQAEQMDYAHQVAMATDDMLLRSLRRIVAELTKREVEWKAVADQAAYGWES